MKSKFTKIRNNKFINYSWPQNRHFLVQKWINKSNRATIRNPRLSDQNQKNKIDWKLDISAHFRHYLIKNWALQQFLAGRLNVTKKNSKKYHFWKFPFFMTLGGRAFEKGKWKFTLFTIGTAFLASGLNVTINERNLMFEKKN